MKEATRLEVEVILVGYLTTLPLLDHIASIEICVLTI
jgi:hypothetical protein